MKVLFLFLLVSIMQHTAFGAKKTDGQFDVVQETEKINVAPRKGYHLNHEAPAFMTIDGSTNKKNPTVKKVDLFEYEKPKKSKRVKLDFYVCDDEKTVCEKQVVDVQLMYDGLRGAQKKEQRQPDFTKSDDESNIQKNKNSEQTNKDIFSGLSKKQKTLLVFSAPWCPACIRLKSETLNQQDLKKILKSVSLQVINIDLVENESVANIYGVKAIPTMVLVNSNGEEIQRWLDYQEVITFKNSLESVLKDKNSIQEKAIKAEKGDQTAIEQVAQNYYSKMDWANAIKWFSLAKDPRFKIYEVSSKVNLVSDAKDKDHKSSEDYEKTVREAILETKSQIDQLRWFVELNEYYVDQKKEINKLEITQKLEQLENMLSLKPVDLNKLYNISTLGDISGFERIETLDMKQRLLTLLKKHEDVKKIYLQMVDLLDQYSFDLSKPGQVITGIFYYTQSGQFIKAESWHKKLIEQYPTSYVYYQKYANYLLKNKKYSEALLQADKALNYSDGNEPQLNLLKIKILKELGQKNEAIVLINKTLKMTEQFPKKYERTAAQIKDIQKLILK